MCQIPKPLLLILHQLYKVGLIIPIYRWQNWELEGLLWYVQSCKAHECRAKSQHLRFSVQRLAVSSMPPSVSAWVGEDQAGLGKYQPMEVGVKSEREQRPKRCGTHRERWSDDSRAISSTCPGWWLGGPSLTTSQASGFEEVEEEDTD